MAKYSYAVNMAEDDGGSLAERLRRIGESGGRVVSVTWQPSRQVTVGSMRQEARSGYTVVSEYSSDG